MSISCWLTRVEILDEESVLDNQVQSLISQMRKLKLKEESGLI